MNQSSVATATRDSAETLFQHLLVAYDSSEASETALQYAIVFARAFGSLVTVASVQSAADFAVDMESGLGRVKDTHDQLRADLQLVTERLNAAGVRSRAMLRSGSVADVLVQLAASADADLLLLGAYGHKGMDKLRLGSTAEFMLRSMPCAVLTIGPGSVLREHGPRPLRTLLYASSLPAKSGRAGQFVKVLAKKLSARVKIVHVIDDQAHDTRTLAEIREAEMALARDFLDERIEISYELMHGPQSQRILELANATQADLIVFGLEHNSPRPDVMGAISRTIRQAPCPLLTVPGPA